MRVRYDEESQIYRDCKFCHGKGCLACPGEADKDYKKAFPNGPQPIATFNIENPSEMEELRSFFKSLTEHGKGAA